MAGETRITTDHDEIRKWAEARGGKPATVKRTGGNEEVGVLRIDFPGYSGKDSLEEITWDESFAKFDEKNLAFERRLDGGLSLGREAQDTSDGGEHHRRSGDPAPYPGAGGQRLGAWRDRGLRQSHQGRPSRRAGQPARPTRRRQQ